MTYLIIDPTELTAGKPVTSNLMQRIVNNIDDVNGRAEGTETQVVSSNNTIAVRNSTLVQFADTSAGGFTTTLPPATDMLNKTLIFKKISTDGNTWTIEGAGSDTIEGQLNQILTTQNQVIYIVSDGTYWWKVSDIDASGQVPQSRAINTSSPLTGGGNLTTDRTLSLALADGQIYIGNSSNVPVARAVTGDITISNTGVVSIATGAIVNADINASAAIQISKITIDSAVLPSSHNTRDLGSDAVEFKDLFIHNVKHGDATNPNLVISTTSNNGNIQLTPHGTGKTVVSALQIPSGAGVGYLLQSDASGNTSWVAPPSGTSLSGMTDVTLSAPVAHQALVYDGSTWINRRILEPSIGDDAVSNRTLGPGVVTNDKIDNATITLGKLAPLAVTKRLIVADSIGTVTYAAAITSNRLLRSDNEGYPIAIAAITANRALASDSTGYPTAAATTATELGYLSGATSNVQTQLNAKVTHGGFQSSGTQTEGSFPAGFTNRPLPGITIPTTADCIFMQISIRVILSGGTDGSISTRTLMITRNPYTLQLVVTQLGVSNISQASNTTASSITIQTIAGIDSNLFYSMPAAAGHFQNEIQWNMWSSF